MITISHDGILVMLIPPLPTVAPPHSLPQRSSQSIHIEAQPAEQLADVPDGSITSSTACPAHVRYSLNSDRIVNMRDLQRW
jgi:hypothetical protein